MRFHERVRPDFISPLQVSYAARPAFRMSLLNQLVYLLSPCQDGGVLAFVALDRRDELQGVVTMQMVGPMHNPLHPLPRGIQALKAPRRPGRRVFQGAEQRHRVRVVIADRRLLNKGTTSQFMECKISQWLLMFLSISLKIRI